MKIFSCAYLQFTYHISWYSFSSVSNIFYLGSLLFTVKIFGLFIYSGYRKCIRYLEIILLFWGLIISCELLFKTLIRSNFIFLPPLIYLSFFHFINRWLHYITSTLFLGNLCMYTINLNSIFLFSLYLLPFHILPFPPRVRVRGRVCVYVFVYVRAQAGVYLTVVLLTQLSKCCGYCCESPSCFDLFNFRTTYLPTCYHLSFILLFLYSSFLM